MAVIHESLRRQARLLYQDIVTLKGLGCITETNLGASSTYSDLKTAVNAVAIHETHSQMRARIVRHMDQHYDAGYITDANVAAAAGETSGTRIDYLLGLIDDLAPSSDPNFTNVPQTGNPLPRE